MKILIAEDNPEYLIDYIEIAEEYYPRKVKGVENAKALIEQFETARKPYDLIISDNCMPQEDDGINAVKVIREIEARKKISRTPFYIMSNINCQEKAINAGADGFLLKISSNFFSELEEIIKDHKPNNL